MEVYLDVLILLNFLVDFLLILGTNRLCGHPPCVKRALGAAVVGGLYAGFCVLPGFGFLGNWLWRIVSLWLMSLMAFGHDQSGLRRGVLFLLLSMALGGFATGMNRGGFWSLVLAAGGVCVLCLLGFRGRVGQQQYVPVTIYHGEKSVALTALVDTGNTLLDPVSGRPVLVADAASAQRLLGLDGTALSRPVETIASCKYVGLRLIPYSAVGQSRGLLLGILADRVEVNGKETDYVVAFAPQRLGQGQFQALAGGAL